MEPFSPSNEKRIEALKMLRIVLKTYLFQLIPNLTDVEQLIRETKSFTDFYWFEFLNLRESGKEFREWLKKLLKAMKYSDKVKAEKYMKDVMKNVMKIIEDNDIKVRGVCMH